MVPHASQPPASASRAGLPSDTGGKDLGVFLPMANGGWILSSTAPTLDGSYAYNREVAMLAERLGLDFIMAMAKWRGYGGRTEHWRYSLDAQMLMAALAAQTTRVKVWTTVHTLLQNPAVTAKMIATLDHISQGRAGLNIVTGAFRDEFEQMGAWPEHVGHDARYDLAAEWIEAIKRLWVEPSVTLEGAYFKLHDCESFPKPLSKPFLVCAGASARGMRFSVEQADAIFLGGADIAELARNSRQAKAMAHEAGRRIKTYSMLNLVIGDSDAAALAAVESYRGGFDEEAFHGMLRAYGFLDSEMGKENAFTRKARSGFMSEYLAGAPETLTAQIIDLLDSADLDGLMLIFPDYLQGLPIFAEQILPSIRARYPVRQGAPAHAG